MFDIFWWHTHLSASSSDHKILQIDLNTLFRRCNDWLLSLSVHEGVIPHIENKEYSNVLAGRQLRQTSSQNDLGVIISSGLSWSELIQIIFASSRRNIHLISRSFRICDPVVCSNIYKIYFRHFLEFAGPVWCPNPKGDVKLLKSIQRWSTRIPYGHRRPTYADSLMIMKLPRFTDRRHRGNSIFTFRILHRRLRVDLYELFTLNHNHLREHNLKLRKEIFRITSS